MRHPRDVLSPRMLRVIEDLVGDWRRVDERIEGLSSKIEALARQDKGCERLMTVPALGRSSRVRGGRDRHWRYVLERPRLRRVAWAGTETNLHRRPNNSRQRIKTRQSLICVLDLGENGTTAGIELVSCRELLATSKMLLEGAGSKSKATGCRIKRAERRR
jgi:hypothetical protein